MLCQLVKLARDSFGGTMFKIVALIAIGGLAVMGFFDLGQIAWIMSAVLLGIGAIIDFSRKNRTS
jgi:hypothetical protein